MQAIDTLIETLAAAVGATNISRDPESLAYATSDLFPFPPALPAELVVRPASTHEASEAVHAIARSGRALLARGAGLSYTKGNAAQQPVVVVDTARLDSIRINADDLYAVVGAGVSWQRLSDALAPLGLRSQVPGPISGAVTTVGGAVSQYVPGSMDGILGLTLVLADGTVARTGVWSREGSEPFHRHAGPDLTGLFIGDCGAFGVKTEIVLRLVEQRPAAFASFAYTDPGLLMDDMLHLQRAGLVSRAMAMDQSRGSDAGKLEAGEALKVAGAVASAAGSALSAIRDVASMVKGKIDLAFAPWSLHLTAEGATQQIADLHMGLARAHCARHAREIEDTVPRALRARPYSIRGFVGVQGERWVPVHGMLAPSKARAAFDEIAALFETYKGALQDAGVRHSYLMSCPGAFMTIEPMFFWSDALDPLHLHHLSERNRERFGGKPVNTAAREVVTLMRARLREVFERHDAVHAQVGRFYRHAQRLDAGSLALLRTLKRGLDPDGRVNPGLLGLDSH